MERRLSTRPVRLDPKRALDLTLGTALMVVAAPLLLAGLLAVAANRPAAGVLVREYRTGLHGRPFIVRSLRTRRFRLDLLSRLPQVIRGRMALVGPAPLPFGSAAASAPWRHLVRPGLTGLAAISRHSTMPWDEPALLDQHYVEHHWIGMDMAILARTPIALFAAHRKRRTPASASRLPRTPPASLTPRTPRTPLASLTPRSPQAPRIPEATEPYPRRRPPDTSMVVRPSASPSAGLPVGLPVRPPVK